MIEPAAEFLTAWLLVFFPFLSPTPTLAPAGQPQAPPSIFVEERAFSQSSNREIESLWAATSLSNLRLLAVTDPQFLYGAFVR